MTHTPLNELTKQQAFDQALTHMRKQGRKANDPETHTCYYRHPDDPNLKCAVGALTPDSTEIPAGLVCSADRFITEYLHFPMTSEEQHFFNSLQASLHDHIIDSQDFHTQLEDNAKVFAEYWGLEYSAP